MSGSIIRSAVRLLKVRTRLAVHDVNSVPNLEYHANVRNDVTPIAETNFLAVSVLFLSPDAAAAAD